MADASLVLDLVPLEAFRAIGLIGIPPSYQLTREWLKTVYRFNNFE